MSSWDFMNTGELNEESRMLINYFAKDTTEKIFRRMTQMDIKSPRVRSSIHAVIYNNAGGNDALVRFYYLNIARFIELGVGRFKDVDWDLNGEGVKVTNIDIPELASGNYHPLTPEFGGTTEGRYGHQPVKVGRQGRNKAGETVDRAKRHKARPFLMNTIRLEMRRIANRLATQMIYTQTVYMVKGMSGLLALDEADKEWRKQQGYIEQMRADLGALHMPELEQQ